MMNVFHEWLKWIFYLLHLIYFYFVIIWSVSDHIKEICHGYWICDRYLINNYFGYEVDLADGQWREFRNNLLLLSATAIGTSFLTRAYQFILPNTSTMPLRLCIGIIVLIIQHRYHSLIILSLAIFGYKLVKLPIPSTYKIPLIWLYAIFILLFKESYRIQSSYPFLKIFFDSKLGGLYNWRLPANFLVLRIISFSFDYLEAKTLIENQSNQATNTNSKDKDPNPSDPNVVNDPNANDPNNIHSNINALDWEEYHIFNYLGYILYAPLYIGGPIITYNTFMKYDTSSKHISEYIPFYALRFLLALALLEYLTHKFPFFAIIQSGLLSHLSLLEIAIIFYMILKLMWLKFLILWRFFRLWALLDGVDPPENMTKCMSNNYSLEQFWKGWHTSFNKWIVHYIYKPLGGRHSRWISSWIIFLFVALWHDFEWKLLLWGLLNAGFYLIEIKINQWREKIRNQSQGMSVLDQILVSMVGALYIIILIFVNLIGYSIGSGTISLVWSKIMNWNGLKVFLGTIYFFSIGVHMMMTIESYHPKHILHKSKDK